MKKVLIVLLFIGCTLAEFQKFSDESLINGRWYSSDNSEEIIFDTEANTYSMNGAAPIEYKYIDNEGEFTINGFVAGSSVFKAEIRINEANNKIGIKNFTPSNSALTFITYKKIE